MILLLLDAHIRIELSALTSSRTDEEMAKRIVSLEESIAGYEGRLVALRSGTRKIDLTEKAKVDRFYDLYMKEWKVRKRMVHYRSLASLFFYYSFT